MENVMLNASQTQIKIVDFGLSNIWSNESPLRTHCGSPEYAAPELFIAGKEYGPEVDLWSLGIIFYGMVVGQLPFVGGRKHELSSQERRKRLVAQINKGLGTTQRQALAPLSPEFRTLLNKLLTADPAKRISIKELLAHPWITEKGKKSVQKHPFKQLDNIIQTKITMQLADLFQVNDEAISGELQKSPFGRLGGMYNVLKFKYVMEDFNPDNIAPSAQKSEVAATPIKVMQKPKTNVIAKSQHTLYNQCIVLLNKVSQHQVENRAKSANQAVTLTKSPSRTRPKTEQAHKQTVAKANYAKITSLAFKRNNPEKNVAVSPTLRKTTSSKCGVAVSRGEPASASLKQRPHTTETRTTNSAKSNKRTIVSAAAPTVFKESNREFQRRQTYLNMAGMGDEICAKHMLSNVVARKPRLKKPLANEPIARSIAGYVLKNVPNYMLNKTAEIRK